MNALGTTILSVALALVLLAPRRWALLGMLLGVMYLPQAQQTEFGGFTLFAFRFVEVCGFLRVLTRREISLRELNRIDWTLIALHLFTVGVFSVRSDESKTYEAGVAVDAILSYLTFRGLMVDLETLKQFLRDFVILLVPFAAFVVYETVTFRNVFSALGGFEMAGGGDAWIRNDRLRAVGSFGHPSLMGTLGGTFIAFYMGLFMERTSRVRAFVGGVSCLAIVFASNSGGPATCIAIAAIGWSLWPLRTNMRWVRRSLVASLILVAAVMEAPIWYLIARLGNLIGGDGWHRAELLAVAFRNFDVWWLAGMPLRDTATWLPYTNNVTGAVDMTNHFLAFGITAGIGATVLLLILVVRGFRAVGQSVMRLATEPDGDQSGIYLYWAMGVTLAVHVGNWFSISYWDQISVVWFMHVAVLSSLAAVTHSSPQAANSSVRFVQTGRPVQLRDHFRPARARRQGM